MSPKWNAASVKRAAVPFCSPKHCRSSGGLPFLMAVKLKETICNINTAITGIFMGTSNRNSN
ncbi:hypothetical protein MAR_011283 [Mya arenaria]|uniref:Uncharacterized protein n=1 Tax=Mya arenaria TaxID=6604 RepID=A0ABY7FXI2_MYAAR|nr:hypothetical protein MAR_011283 [Mya arenaria]